MKGLSDNKSSKNFEDKSNKKELKKPLQLLQLNKKNSLIDKNKEKETFPPIVEKETENELKTAKSIESINSNKSSTNIEEFIDDKHLSYLEKPLAKEKTNANIFERTVDDFDFDEDAFLAALNENEPIGLAGETIKGKIIALESDGLYVDIGGKAPGYMPKKESCLGVITNFKERFPIGMEIEVLVIKEQNADGMVTVSARALILRKSWENVSNIAKTGALVNVLINGFNRGGLTCDIEGLRGFIPRSQLEEGLNYQSLVNKTIKVAFIEVNPDTRKLVLSEKKATIISKVEKLKQGQLIKGKVLAIKPYGFFIDLGGISGLLHQSSITNGSIRDLREIFMEGEIVHAIVTEINLEKGRIGLNTALLESSPGEILVDKGKIIEESDERARKVQTLFNKDIT
tara:strand:+ start:1728 stop:2930 length:1203 start_codon:yes stop_codon:yes gene_type:complete